jgi:integrase
MARNARSSQLENRTKRLRIAPRWKPYTVRVGPGVRLGYRRRQTAGGWSVIAADGKGGNWLKAFADADDFEDANGKTVLDFWQAQDLARRLARSGKGNEVSSNTPVTVAAALDNYEADLKTRGGDVGNATRVRGHLSDTLLRKAVALLAASELKKWRDALAKNLSDGSINRIANALRAALNLAANTDERIVDRRAWEVGLKPLRDAVETRNVILPAKAIQRIVAEAYAISDEFGLLVETAATTGARVSQLARLEAQDVQRNRADPRLMMPSSRKGKGHKRVTRRPVPVPESLAARLRQAGNQRPKDCLLLVKPSGKPWSKSDHSRLFRRAVQLAGLDPAEVTIYALRHSNIVRQILANVPIRVVAVNHDTSVPMIEKTYSKNIGDHGDALARPALLDLSELPTARNVVPLGRKSP